MLPSRTSIEVVESPSKEEFCWLDKGMSHLLVSVIVLIQERDGARDFQSFLSTSIYVTVTPVPKVRKKKSRIWRWKANFCYFSVQKIKREWPSSCASRLQWAPSTRVILEKLFWRLVTFVIAQQQSGQSISAVLINPLVLRYKLQDDILCLDNVI